MSSMRPYLLASALDQIARQRRVEVEVLLGLHGVVRRARGGTAGGGSSTCRSPWSRRARRRPSAEVLRPGRVQGEWRLTSAKWDDDDWYAPEHLADLLLARSLLPGRTSSAPRPSSSTSRSRWSAAMPPYRLHQRDLVRARRRGASPAGLAVLRRARRVPRAARRGGRRFLKAAHAAGRAVLPDPQVSALVLRRSVERRRRLQQATPGPFPTRRHRTSGVEFPPESDAGRR